MKLRDWQIFSEVCTTNSPILIFITSIDVYLTIYQAWLSEVFIFVAHMFIAYEK